MSGFTALNVEPEDTFEEEIDDTKEIQIEEAFKLYQNALKLHSQGPKFFDAAEDAYKELFQSEVFKYPEAVTDYGHEQLDDVLALPTPANDQAPLPILPTNAADAAANSLPQLIYLSYKNRGQFILDVARHQLDHAPSDRRSTCLYYYQYCLKSLEDSASALERDDTDLDLWKKAARISDVLSSQRLVRFCLESVVAGDDDTGEQTIDLSGLDEAFASSELLQVLKVIQDDTAVVKTSLAQAQSGLLDLLQKSNNPYPYLPERAAHLFYLKENQHPNSFDISRAVIDLRGQTQAALAEAFARALGKDDSPVLGPSLGAVVHVLVPSSLEDVLPSTISEENITVDTKVPILWADPLTRTGQTDSISPNESAQSPASYHSAPDEVQHDPEAETLGSKKAEDSPCEPDIAVQEVEHIGTQDHAPPEMRLPTRKRSSTAAGNEEPESRTKSKRLRARESLMEMAAQEEETAQENDYYVREQLAIIEDADSACLTYMNKLLTRLNVENILHASAWHSTEETNDHLRTTNSQQTKKDLSSDLQQAMSNWTEDLNSAILSGHSSRDLVEQPGGMSLFQRHLKATLPKDTKSEGFQNDDEKMITFARSLNQSKLTLAEATISWLMQLFTSSPESNELQSSYLRGVWTLDMRNNVMLILLQLDEMLLNHILNQTWNVGNDLERGSDPSPYGLAVPIDKAAELVQTVFEMHLDEYYNMRAPESQSTEDSKTEQKDRLKRWAHVATSVMQTHLGDGRIDEHDPLVLRYLLMSATFVGLLSDDNKVHVLSCLADVRTVLEIAGNPTITLPNNKAMPQVSVAAIDQEISRLSTLDFFNSIFDNDNSDPVAIIMKLEPILEPQERHVVDISKKAETSEVNQNSQVAELRAFLDSGDASLKLFLWRRLQNGYAAISYTPKVISCLLRSFETVVREIFTRRHNLLKPQERQLAMFKWLRDADEIMTKILSKISDESKAFECLDDSHLSSSVSAVASLLELLYQFVKYDDSIRVGQTPPPSFRTNTALKLYDKSKDKMRDSFVRGWTLMYHLIKEATVQLPNQFERPIDELAEFLRLVHNVLGHRHYCKQCNKLFIKLAKTELFSTRSEIDYSEDLAQILYDMYQIKLGTGFGDAYHGCTADPLGRDKDTAFNLVPVIMSYARKLSIREWVRSDLKGTVEKIQQTLGQAKTSPALSFNRKAVSALLKSIINPQEVYRSLKGIGDLITKPVGGEYSKVAAVGWYKMLGTMSLAKYKSIKRVTPTPTDDLDTAATYLRLDLDYDIGDWETWYRLAQVFDCKIEDSLIWNAVKINDSRSDIALLERNAINAYTMAVAVAMRSADDNVNTVQKISDMFSEFAFRLYASSRPPLNMEAFNTDKHLRHLSSSQDQSMSKAPFIIPFKPYGIWSFAAYLLQRRFATGQKEWLCYYTLGKCLWKMFLSADNTSAKKPTTVEDVIDAFTDAVELVPAKEKSADYILEPHYKLVSVVHKLVNRKLLSSTKGVEYLQATQFARAVHISQEDQDVEWDTYILEILRKLGQADKSNWHHRITARAAHVNYDDDPNIAGALGAKHQFTQQIFTKTMTMQVWKPEYERPGRHYVYTGRYLSFFVHLLDLLNDRASLEQLVRRIRRKTTDFIDHPKVWEETALTYVKLLRRVGKIPDGHERNIFDKISYDDFSKMSERVEEWAHDPENTSPYQDIVQDAIELKKLNNSLMKGPAIDDLIGDAYACMYEAFVSGLPPEEVAPPSVSILPQGTFINMNTDVVPTGDDNLDRMRLNNLLSAQNDGTVSGMALAGYTTGPGSNTPRTGTPPVEPVRIPTPSKPGRTKTITRREVQRKAEACLVKAPPVKTPTLMKRLLINLPGRRDSNTSNVQEGFGNDRSRGEEEVLDDSRASSRRPSMDPRGSAEPDDSHQDADGEIGDDNDGEADDESELTDLDNDDDDNASKSDKPAKSPFRSIMNRKRKAEDAADHEEQDESGEEDREDDEEDIEEDENEGNITDMEQDKDNMDIDDLEESVLEIQDSQELTGKGQAKPAPDDTKNT